jgi:predicted nucleic-acid-binding protein
MKAIDTHAMVRFLVNDDEKQARKVYELFKQAEAEKKHLFIPLTVLLELIWVLDSVYTISREDILGTVGDLLSIPILKFEHQPAVQQFVYASQGNALELSDLLIAFSAQANGCDQVLTFDKKASGFHLFSLVS